MKPPSFFGKTPSRRTSQSLNTIAGILGLGMSVIGCGDSSSGGSQNLLDSTNNQPTPTSPNTPPSSSPNNPPPNPTPNPSSNPSPTPNTPLPAPALKLPVIIGFTTPSDVLNPGQSVEDLITAELAKGILEVPIYMGGNVSLDGSELLLNGQPPDLTLFANMLNRIEAQQNLSPGTLRIRPYVRASITADDAANNPNGPGRIDLSNTTLKQNLIQLSFDLSENSKYQLPSNRVDEVTFDFEDIVASNYDPADLDIGDNEFAQVVQFISALKTAGFSKKIGLYIAGIADEDWFPSETTLPNGSPFQVSPRNFISPTDLETLFTAGLDTIEVGAYTTFPHQSGSGGFADPNIYGPIHTNYKEFLEYLIQTMRNLGKDPEVNLRIDIPVFSGPEVVSTTEAIAAIRDLIQSLLVQKVNGATFDKGNMDSAEQNEVLSAIR